MRTCLMICLAAFVWTGCGTETSTTATAQDESDQYFSNGDDFAGSHILIAYEGAMRANPEVTRTKEEAEAKAKSLIESLQGDPAQFEDLARSESDGPSGAQGGSLGSWQRGRMVAAFDTAVEQMEVGAISAEPVETEFGYHIIRRDPVKVKYYGAYGFIVAYAGAPRAPQTVTRTKEEAEALAADIGEQLGDDNFDELARTYNDVGEEAIFMGALPENEPLPEGMLDLLQSLPFGGVGGPVEVNTGYLFMKRVQLSKNAASHILIAYQGAERASETITRTKEEAEQMAQDLARRLQDAPDEFEALAQENSDGPSAPRGGDLGSWFKGSMVPEFDNALETMAVGEITATPVESMFGYHIIRKNALPE